MKNDHRSKFSNLSNWKEEAWKNQGFNGIRTRDLRDTGAMLYQLSYEATHWERGQFINRLTPALSDLGLSPGWGHCVVLLHLKACMSHSAHCCKVANFNVFKLLMLWHSFGSKWQMCALVKLQTISCQLYYNYITKNNPKSPLHRFVWNDMNQIINYAFSFHPVFYT